MRVGFFGGTFDPPHRGHLAIARAATHAFHIDRVLFAPTGRQPLKLSAPVAGYADRLTMVRLLCEASGQGFEACELDGPRGDGGANYTIGTLRQLQASEPSNEELFVIVGADSFLDLRKWREPEALLRAAEWIVVSRPGFSLDALPSLGLSDEERQRVHLLQDLHEDVSATEIRRRLALHEDTSEFLTPEVLAYIREHGLYGCGNAGSQRSERLA